MTSLLRYDAACKAIAEAKTVDEVTEWIDKAAAVREYGRRIRNRQIELDAAQIRSDAKRRRGQLVRELKDAGQLREGRKKLSTTDDSLPVFTLADLKLTADESSEEQKIAALDDSSYARLIARCRSYADAHPEKHSINVLKPPPEGGPINGARTVMGSRIEPADSLDYFPTPPWATRALMQHVMPTLDLTPSYVPRGAVRLRSAWEPACGEGHIAEVLAEYADVMIATDIFDYGYGQAADFLAPDLHPGLTADWIITNPPFKERTEQFFQRAMERANVGVALFVRMQWLETNGRYERIYSKTPPTIIAFFAERVPLCKGEWKPDGDTATAYIWLVWVKGRTPQAPFWIPPGCRTDLEHDDDVTRFTTRPVMTERRIVEFCDGDFVDVASGEILNATPPVEEPPANESRSTGNVAQPLSKSESDDTLEIPVFLRRQPDNSFPVTVASPCLAEVVTGEGAS